MIDTTLQPDPNCPPRDVARPDCILTALGRHCPKCNPEPTTVAELHGRRYRGIPACTNCGAPVRTTNYALGPEVEHYDPAASFPTTQKGTAWRSCKTKLIATMPDEAPR